MAATHPLPLEARLSAELHALNDHVREGTATLGEVMDRLGDRAYTLPLFVFALPFATPVPMMGLSTPVGLILGYLGLRLALGLHPKLPERWRSRPVPPRLVGSVLRASERLVRLLERALRRRWVLLSTQRVAHAVAGAVVLAAAALLTLPLPIPGSNMLPAVTILLTAAGLMEEDGVAIAAGWLVFGLTLVFFGAIAFLGVEALDRLRSGVG